MSSILFLTSQDFFIGKGVKGPILCHKIPLFSLVLFYSTRCGHCNTLLPIFKRLPGTVNNCQFGLVNVSTPNGRNIITASKDTISQIDYVPYICLYINGKPYMKYNGPRNEMEIRRFVTETAMNIQAKKQVHHQDIQQPKAGKGIPEYTIGHPLYGDDDVCYLTELELKQRSGK